MLYKIVTLLKRKYWSMHYKKLHFASLARSAVLDNGISFLNPNYIWIGENVYIGSDSAILCFDQYGSAQYQPSLHIGDSVTFTRRATIYCADSVTIGAGALIGSDVLITDENHGVDPRQPYRNNALLCKKVHIGEQVWIGDKAVILPGVTIGDYTIIGAGAVVTENMPPYAICAGTPARVLKIYDHDAHMWKSVKSAKES